MIMVRSDLRAGNTGGDSTPPTIAITTPTSNPTHVTGTQLVSFGGTASDAVGVDRIEYSTTGATVLSGTASGTTSWTQDLTLNAGETVVTFTAFDAAGNSAQDSITVTVDQIDPSVTITSPTSNATYNTTGSTTTVGGSASDAGGAGLTSVTYSLSGATSGSGTCSGTTSWSTGSLSLNQGTTTITITATDGVGNTSQDTLSVLRDSSGPTVTITSPTTATTYSTTGSSVNIGGTASDAYSSIAAVSYTLSGATTGSGSCSGTTSWTASGISLNVGATTITVTATDTLGNTGTDTITVTREEMYYLLLYNQAVGQSTQGIYLYRSVSRPYTTWRATNQPQVFNNSGLNWSSATSFAFSVNATGGSYSSGAGAAGTVGIVGAPNNGTVTSNIAWAAAFPKPSGTITSVTCYGYLMTPYTAFWTLSGAIYTGGGPTGGTLVKSLSETLADGGGEPFDNPAQIGTLLYNQQVNLTLV